MARVRRGLNILNSWEQIGTAVEANAAELQHLTGTHAKLMDTLGKARILTVEQSMLTASKQEASRKLREVLREGEALADVLRTAARAHFGTRSEKLVEFGMQPFRGRRRTTDEKPPVSPSPKPPEAPSSQPASEPEQ